MTQSGMRVTSMRSALGRARGLGSAGSGVHHWWVQRLTSVALLPLTLWFVVSVLVLAGGGRDAVLAFAHAPWNAALLLAFVVATFYHLQLGLQVVIEDYFAVPRRLAVLLAMRAAVWLAGLMAVLAVLRLAI